MLRDVKLVGWTIADGSATINATEQIAGLLVAVEWVKSDGVNAALADGVDGTLTLQSTPSGVARTILTLTNANANAFYNPREAEHDNTGTATTSGSTCYPLVVGKPRLTIAQGGDTKYGGAILYYLPI